MDNSPIYYECFEAIDRARRAYDYERGALAADDAATDPMDDPRYVQHGLGR